MRCSHGWSPSFSPDIVLRAEAFGVQTGCSALISGAEDSTFVVEFVN